MTLNLFNDELLVAMTTGAEAFVFTAKEKQGTLEVTSDDILRVGVATGNPFKQCFSEDGDGTPEEFEGVIGTAKYKVNRCIGGMGLGEVYFIDRLEITDTHPSLGAQAGKTLVLNRNDAKMSLRYNRHNSCDSLVIRVNGAIYGMTNHVKQAFNESSCIAQTDAPKIVNPNESDKAIYQIIYSDGSKVVGSSKTDRLF